MVKVVSIGIQTSSNKFDFYRCTWDWRTVNNEQVILWLFNLNCLCANSVSMVRVLGFQHHLALPLKVGRVGWLKSLEFSTSRLGWSDDERMSAWNHPKVALVWELPAVVWIKLNAHVKPNVLSIKKPLLRTDNRVYHWNLLGICLWKLLLWNIFVEFWG